MKVPKSLSLLPVVVFSLILAAGAAYYFLHVEPRREYLIELEQRRLEAIAERIDTQLADYRRLVGNGGAAPRLEILEEKTDCTPKPASVETDKEDWSSFRLTSDCLTARLRAGHLVEPALERHELDKLILAGAAGNILYQTGSASLRLRTLEALDGIGQDSLKRLSRSAGVLDVGISGKAYKLFFRPLEGEWILCGLMPTGALRMESFKIPADWIIRIVGGFLVALLAVPFLKLATLGKEERLRANDGLLVVLCALIGVSLLAILLLDGIVYSRLYNGADEQLKELAKQVKEDLDQELSTALSGLRDLHEKASNVEDASTLTLPLDSPHVDFFWADSDGKQVFKWTRPGEQTRPISVRDREYFQDALAGRLLPGGFAIQPVRSWTTGEYMEEIAIPGESRNGEDVVAVLSTVLASVHRPVLPPGFGFAVIEPEGRVLFHSDSKRAIQENFLKETDSRKLEALLFANRRDWAKVRYLGRQHRVYTMPVEGLPWTIVTFRDLTLLRAIHVQIVTVALASLVLYAGLFLLLFIVVYLLSATRAHWIWPAPARRGTYLQLAVFYAGCLLAYLVPLFAGDPVFLLINGMLVPLLVLFVSYVKVRSDQGLWGGKQWAAVAITTVTLLLSVGIGVWRLWPERPVILAVSVAALAVGALFLFSRVVTRFFERGAQLQPTRGAYLVSATLLLMVVTILPAASFFKMARDLPAENLVKHGQVHLLRQLERQRASLPVESFPGDYSDVFFATQPALCEGVDTCSPKPVADPHESWLVGLQEASFPIYNEHSREMARFTFDAMESCPWQWQHLQGGGLRLHGRRDKEGRTIHLSSMLPSARFDLRGWGWLAAGVVALALIARAIIAFLAGNLLLLRPGSPLWLSRRRLLALGMESPSGGAEEFQMSLKKAQARLAAEHRPWIEDALWNRQVDRCIDLVRRECSPTARLQEIGRGLLSDLRPEELDRGGLLNEIERLAQGHYEELWASLEERERVVLLQLAEEGLVNPKNVQPLERLIARGLVLCDPAPRLMNESFRCYIISACPKDAVNKIEQESGRHSLWGRLQRPVYATLLGLALFVGFTQKEALSSTIALITAVTGALPHVLKLVGFLGPQKTGGAPGG